MEAQWLVWSNEHRAWWRPESCGYTQSLKDAGRYSRDEAIKICAFARDGMRASGVPSEIPVQEADMLAALNFAERRNG